MHYFSILSTSTYAMKDFRFQSLWISLWHIMKQRKRTKKVFQFSVEHIVLHKQKFCSWNHYITLNFFWTPPQCSPTSFFMHLKTLICQNVRHLSLFLGHSPPTNVSGPLYDSFKIFKNFLLNILFLVMYYIYWLGNDVKITM